jgi:hypothetical protein
MFWTKHNKQYMNKEQNPPLSLMNLYKSYNKILTQTLNNRINQTSVHKPCINVIIHPCFANTNKATKEPMTLNRASSASRERHKVGTLTYDQEIIILSHYFTNRSMQVEFKSNFFSIVLFIFAIRENFELYNLKFGYFRLGVEKLGLLYLK